MLGYDWGITVNYGDYGMQYVWEFVDVSWMYWLYCADIATIYDIQRT